MLTQQERMKLLEELAKSAPKMTDADLVATGRFVTNSVRENPRQDAPLKLVSPDPLVARR